ncbi:MAG: hypothetical protein CM1200mP13_13350 [Candidatus Pelagibacterales bacterium]|nr:MAG: hypothetical protein CM1200mP13_13350 [Pelagibacterales bacterium]
MVSKIKNILDPAEKEGKIKNVGKVFENGGEEGLWIPTYMVKKNPKLKTIEGVLQHPELFPHPEDSSKAAFYGCPAGWNCQITTTKCIKLLEWKKLVLLSSIQVLAELCQGLWVKLKQRSRLVWLLLGSYSNLR